MKNRFCCLVFLFCSTIVFGQESIPERVLFVGNSYTYFWNLPLTVDLMAESSDISIDVDHSTAGGSHWGHHWRGERGLITRDKISSGNYDAVIIQNHSKSAFERTDSLSIFGERLVDLIKESGATPYVYITWGREWDPYMQKTITETYIDFAKRVGAEVVPIGPAWERARKLRPDIDLYHYDGHHQSSLGTYLSACVFYGILTGNPPIGLPHRLITEDKNGEIMYLTIQSPNDALFCQKVAEEIIEEWK